MKALNIFLLIMILATNSEATKNPKPKKKVKDTSVESNKFDIKFNGLGMPDKNWQYVPFGSQINLIAMDVNPLKELPKIEAFFKNYYITNPNDGVDLAGLLTPPKPAAANQKESVEAKESSENLARKTSAVFSKVSSNIKFNKNSVLLKQISELSTNIASAKFADSTQQRKDNLVKADANLQNIDIELEALRTRKKVSDDEINKLKMEIAQLQKELDRQALISKLTPVIKDTYKAFTNSLSELHSLLTLQPAVTVLFTGQFVKGSEAKKSIEELVKSRIPTANADLSNILSEQTSFIKNKLEMLENEYSDLSTQIKLINDQLPSDSFKSEGITKVPLKNKDKVESQLEIKDFTVRVSKDPLFKDQLDYATGLIKQFRRQTFRDSLQIYTDSVMINTLKLYNSSFEKPIKTFQANTDEIKVTLPYATAEPYFIKTTHRFKVTGSTGLFVHMLNTGDKYKTVIIDSAAPSKGNYPLLIKQQKERVLYSFGITANFFNYVPYRWFNVGGTLGINVPINNQTNTGFLQLVGGLCLASNTVDRLIITVGASIRRGQKLNTNNLVYATDNDVKGYKFKNVSELEPVYDPTAQVGFFIGISYSLFGASKSSQTE